mgnify:CR=1 FL=1
MKPMAKNTKHKKAESVAETLCSFSGFLCDIVISVYMIVILMVLPLYNKGYARIGTEKETFFLKTMTYGAKALLPVFLLWLLFRLVTAVQKKELPKFTEWPAGLWKNLSVTDRFAVFYGIAGDSVLADGNVDAAGSGDHVFYDLPYVAVEELDPGAGTAGVCGCFFSGICE